MNPADPFGLIGQVLDGQFRVDKFVGEGGFSIVYRGHHAGLNEPIAIKCLKLPPALGSALVESFLRRFRDESRIHYRLSQGSLAIARSIASGTTMSSSTSALVPYMVLEWLEGRSLAQDFEVRRVHGKTGRTMEETVKLLDTAAQGLAFAHAQGVVHRDMNPGNLFLAERQQGQPQGVMTKVLDFGVAKVVSDHALEMGPRAQTLGQIRIFAPAYGAPEQFDDSVGKVGPQSDVYSFAIIALEALRDLPVRDGEHLGEFALKALDPNGRPTPRSLGVPVGDAVEDVFKRAAALRPEDRPMDMGQFWGGLKHAIREDAESGKAPHADYVPSRPGPPWKPHPPAAGQPPVSANVTEPAVEVTRPGSTAPPPVDPGQSQVHRGTVRMQSSSPPQPPRPGSGAAALSATPLTSTLVMETRFTPPPQPAAKPALNATLAMPSPYARSQDVPAVGAAVPIQTPLPAATVAMNTGSASFAAARAMAEAGAAATVAASDGDSAFAGARAMAESAALAPTPPPSLVRAEVSTVVPPPPASRAKIVAIAVVVLVLVGAVGFFAFRSRQGGDEAPPPPPSNPRAASALSAAPASMPPAAPPASPTAVATAAPTAAEPVAPAAPVATAPGAIPEPAHATEPASPRRSPPTAPAPRPTALPIAAPGPTAQAQPAAPTPIAGPTTPGGFDPTTARAALDLINGVLASCRNPGGKTGNGTINVTFSPDGHAERAIVDEPPFTGTPEGACVASRFKQAKIAPFAGAPGSIVYTFHIPN